MTAGTVTIHIVNPDPVSNRADAPILTPDETIRAASFRFPGDAAHWTSNRAALRRILGESLGIPPLTVPILLTETGKPVLSPPFDSLHFSISHCHDLALVALCADGPVGIDLEPLARARDLAGCETTFCHPAEIKSLPAGHRAANLRLLEIWTAKEALLKALGTGLLHPPDSVLIHFHTPHSTASSTTPLPGISHQVLHSLHHPLLANHRASLSAPTTTTRIEFIPHEISTSRPHDTIITPPST